MSTLVLATHNFLFCEVIMIYYINIRFRFTSVELSASSLKPMPNSYMDMYISICIYFINLYLQLCPHNYINISSWCQTDSSIRVKYSMTSLFVETHSTTITMPWNDFAGFLKYFNRIDGQRTERKANKMSFCRTQFLMLNKIFSNIDYIIYINVYRYQV